MAFSIVITLEVALTDPVVDPLKNLPLRKFTKLNFSISKVKLIKFALY